MDTLQNYLFGKLEINMYHCSLFYGFMVISFVFFVIGCLGLVVELFTGKKRKTVSTLNIILSLVQIFLAYFTNRLLYTMCVRSI